MLSTALLCSYEWSDFVVITLKFVYVIFIRSIIDLRKFSIFFKPYNLYLATAYALLDFANSDIYKIINKMN